MSSLPWCCSAVNAVMSWLKLSVSDSHWTRRAQPGALYGAALASCPETSAALLSGKNQTEQTQPTTNSSAVPRAPRSTGGYPVPVRGAEPAPVVVNVNTWWPPFPSPEVPQGTEPSAAPIAAGAASACAGGREEEHIGCKTRSYTHYLNLKWTQCMKIINKTPSLFLL